jgi:GT2 family glycosyltransferase
MTGAPAFSLIITPGGAVEEIAGTRRSIDAQGVEIEIIECETDDDRGTSLRGAVAAACGDFLVFIDPGDSLHPDALRRVSDATGDAVDMVYTDEDILDREIHRDPFFKPDWSPDRTRAQHYTGRLAAYRRSAVSQIGGVRPSLLDAYEHDLVLRLWEHGSSIVHVPYPLYHRAPRARSTLAATDHGRRAIEQHLERTSAHLRVELDDERQTYRLRPALSRAPLVTIVIPSGGTRRKVNGELLPLVVNCVESIVQRSTYQNFEIVCVADEHIPTEVVEQLRAHAGDRLTVVPFSLPFNFAQKVNVGVLHSHGEYVLLLNDDTEVLTSDWIEAMLGFAMDPGVGAVGAMLNFPDGRIQHAGIVASDGNPGHPYYGYRVGAAGYFGNLSVPCNYLAVTAACVMTAREHFDRVGGFSTDFPLNYNDVDYGIKLHRHGYRSVLTPEVTLIHRESASRGVQRVADEELALLTRRWEGLLRRDPFYNPNFLPGADFLTLIVQDGRTPAELD